MLIPKGGYQTYNGMVDRIRNTNGAGGAGHASYSLGNYYGQIDDDDEFNHSFDGATRSVAMFESSIRGLEPLVYNA